MGAGKEPRQPVPSCQAWSNHGVQATAVTLRSTAAPDAQRSALYISLEGMNGAMDFHRIDELMEPLVALPDGLNARLAIPRPG